MVRRDNEREFIAEPEKEQTVPDETRHESADLDDYSTQEPADSLTGEPGQPGDDPLDRGVAPPERWSAVIRSGSDGSEQESLDQLLGEEEPDTALDLDDELPKTARTTTRPTSTSTACYSTMARTRGRAG